MCAPPNQVRLHRDASPNQVAHRRMCISQLGCKHTNAPDHSIKLHTNACACASTNQVAYRRSSQSGCTHIPISHQVAHAKARGSSRAMRGLGTCVERTIVGITIYGTAHPRMQDPAAEHCSGKNPAAKHCSGKVHNPAAEHHDCSGKAQNPAAEHGNGKVRKSSGAVGWVYSRSVPSEATVSDS